MHLDGGDQRLEAPRQVVRVGVELDGDRARGVDLGVDRLRRPARCELMPSAAQIWL